MGFLNFLLTLSSVSVVALSFCACGKHVVTHQESTVRRNWLDISIFSWIGVFFLKTSTVETEPSIIMLDYLVFGICLVTACYLTVENLRILASITSPGAILCV